ncbi:GM22870 [Drosophila sechellia]|uniref:GM22870 n=1 Tax=Drosophila sechellia TaxID=7238 RepID=B4I6M2_DROSE|nr:GM22870 [Drosophila sechellia]
MDADADANANASVDKDENEDEDEHEDEKGLWNSSTVCFIKLQTSIKNPVSSGGNELQNPKGGTFSPDQYYLVHWEQEEQEVTVFTL